MNDNQPMEETNHDRWYRTLAGAIDFAVLFSSMYFWWMGLILVFSDIIPYTSFAWFQQFFLIFLWSVSLLIPLGFLIWNPGSSVGKTLAGYRIVKRDLTDANRLQIIAREMLLKPVAILVLWSVVGFLGIALYVLVIILVPRFNKAHDSLFDLITGTKVIVEPSKESLRISLFG
ncbi:MAG: RDD family protein [Erysipelotrichaceae bacterium]